MKRSLFSGAAGNGTFWLGVILTLGILPLVPRVDAAGTITGTVFRDFDVDGTRDSSEPGVSSVVVTAYDATGARVGQTATCDTMTVTIPANAPAIPATINVESCTLANVGSYSLAASGTGPYRIEFTNVPGFLQPGAFGGQNGTTVQYVPDGASANVNLALNYSQDFCQANPNLATSCYVNGDTSSVAPVDVLVALPYAGSGNGIPQSALPPGTGTATISPQHLASKSEVGSAWGLAYARQTKTLYAATFLKRHAGIGPNGLGAIYQVTNANSASPGIPSLFVDLAAQGIDVGGTAVTGSPGFSSNATRGLGFPGSANADANAFGQVGTVGLGGLTISDDETTIYTVNLFDKMLYAIPIATPTAPNIQGVLIPDPSCVNGNWRPFAVKYSRGELYVGGICDAQTSNDAADLKAVVYRVNGSTFTSVLSFSLDPLTYPKGLARNPCANTGTDQWYPWLTTLSPAPSGPSISCSSGSFFSYPQPILSDIEFDVDGSMMLGFIDRWGHQVGQNNLWPDGVTFNEVGITAGDILRSVNSGGVFQDPTSTEFYTGEAISIFGAGHDETSLGGLTFIPGTGEIALTAMDPVRFTSGGVIFLDNVSGAQSPSRPGYEVYNGDLPFFGKVAGLGDLTSLCDAAPLEIGNRVWRDTDRDGIQDPGESTISGVTVQLFKSNTLVGTAVTDTNGTYYFVGGTAIDSDLTDHIGIVNGGILPAMAYEVRIDTTQSALTGITLTTANAADTGAADGGANADQRDSDGNLSGSTAIAAFTTGGPGANNHTFDFGFAPPVPPSTFSIGNRVWLDNGVGGGVANDGMQNGAEPGIASVVVKLFACDGAGNPTGAVLQTVTTDSSGYYRFDGVTAGCYIVAVDVTASGAALSGLSSSTGAIDTQTNTTDRKDAGGDTPLGAGTALPNGIASGRVNVASGTLPSAEMDIFGTGLGAHGPSGDGNDTLLVDFGFVAPAQPPPPPPVGTVDLSLTKAGPTTAILGQGIAYSITVRNLSSATATNVVVTDPIPGAVRVIQATAAGGSCSGTTTIICTIATLAPNASATVTILGTVNSLGSVTNIATVQAAQSESVTSNNQGQTTVQVNQPSSGSPTGPSTGPESPIVVIPTLSEWGLLILATLLATLSWGRLRQVKKRRIDD